jgi:hypothetical protein
VFIPPGPLLNYRFSPRAKNVDEPEKSTSQGRSQSPESERHSPNTGGIQRFEYTVTPLKEDTNFAESEESDTAGTDLAVDPLQSNLEKRKADSPLKRISKIPLYGTKGRVSNAALAEPSDTQIPVYKSPTKIVPPKEGIMSQNEQDRDLPNPNTMPIRPHRNKKLSSLRNTSAILDDATRDDSMTTHSSLPWDTSEGPETKEVVPPSAIPQMRLKKGNGMSPMIHLFEPKPGRTVQPRNNTKVCTIVS